MAQAKDYENKLKGAISKSRYGSEAHFDLDESEKDPKYKPNRSACIQTEINEGPSGI